MTIVTVRVGCDVPHIVDVNWRLDYCIKVCLKGFNVILPV